MMIDVTCEGGRPNKGIMWKGSEIFKRTGREGRGIHLLWSCYIYLVVHDITKPHAPSPFPNKIKRLVPWGPCCVALRLTAPFGAVPRKFLGIVAQDPSDSKSNQLHVDIFQFCFIHVRYIL